MKQLPWKSIRLAAIALVCLGAKLLPAHLALGQTNTGQTNTGQTSSGYSGAAPASGASGVASGAGGSLGQNPFTGSVPRGTASSEVLPLSFTNAIDRGLQNNLGLLLQSDNTIAARGEKWKELSELLPNLTTATSENAAQTNLAAQGLRLPGFPRIVGPFGFFDTRVYLTQSLFSLKALNRERGAFYSEKAAQYTYKDARDVVVLAVGNAYLQALAGGARVETAQAQVQTAQALYDKSVDQQNAGVSPAIDTLRAKVELQARQQQLIVARNDYAKQKLALARVIGLPPGQEFTLSDSSDYQAALQQVQAGEHFRKAATAEYFPTVDVAGNYGDIGVTPGNSHGTFQVAGTLRVPIFQGGKVHADVLQAEATLRQSHQQLENLRGQIDYDVRTALLDLGAAADQVEVARSSVDLAGQTLIQARDRFAAGVTDNLEVVQAQESVATANENYISSLYAHNLAKVALARAMGYAEAGVKQYLKSK